MSAAIENITTVFFDFGGTLCDLRAERVVLLQGDLKRIGLDVPRDDVERALQAGREWDRQNSARYAPDYESRTNRFVSFCRAIVESLGLPGDRAAIARRLWEAWDAEPGVWVVYPDVRPCLEALAARGLRLGVISNWDKRNLPETCEQISIARCFDVILSSAQANADKPDPAIFRTALEMAGARPEESAHVGDSLQADAEGATNAGMKGIWLVRDAEPPPSAFPVIRTLTDLPALIEPQGRTAVRPRDCNR
jgi:putative hydrolase of the HAD superfamily